MNKHLDAKLNLESFEVIVKYLCGCGFESEDFSSLFRRLKVTSESNLAKFLAPFKETLVEKFGLAEFKTTLEAKSISKIIHMAKFDSKNVEDKLHILGDCFASIFQSVKQKQIMFSRQSYTYLTDCTIVCNSNQELSCHKCVLVARYLK